MRRIYEAVIKTQRESIEKQFAKNLEDTLGARVRFEEDPNT
jgi:hypothetical protein